MNRDVNSSSDAGPPAGPSRFAAFISYRHVEPDRRWAKWLYAALETYRVPAKLVEQRGILARVGRVFRDEEELPASADLSQEIDAGAAGVEVPDRDLLAAHAAEPAGEPGNPPLP